MAVEEIAETKDLIGSDKVEGTAVFSVDGEKMGTIERVMLGKADGKVAYAVLQFGGFLGLGHDHYPLPWSSLSYDETLGGYKTNVSAQRFASAPKYATNDSDWSWNSHYRKVEDYYSDNNLA
jgi:hypothetical protein